MLWLLSLAAAAPIDVQNLPPAATLAPKGKVPVELQEPGCGACSQGWLYQAKLSAPDKEGWWGLFVSSAGIELQPVRIKEVSWDPTAEGKASDYPKACRAENPTGPRLILRGLPLTAGLVPGRWLPGMHGSAQVGEPMVRAPQGGPLGVGPAAVAELRVEGVDGVLIGPAAQPGDPAPAPPSHTGTLRYESSAGALDLLGPLEALYDASVYARFIGDLDRDGRLDLILQITGDTTDTAQSLLLSGQGAPLTEVAGIWEWDCC